MNLPNLTSADFLPLLPAVILVVGACILLLSEVFLSAHSSRGYQAVLSTATSVLLFWRCSPSWLMVTWRL